MIPLLMLIDSFKRKGNAETESQNYLAEKKRLELFSSGIYRMYMLWLYSLLVKQCGSWVLDTELVSMKCHTGQHNS